MDMTGSSSNTFLSVEALTYTIDGQPILSGINFEIKSGEQVAIFGPSGAGKSTLIRLINRLDEPTSGVIRVDGQDYRTISPRSLRKRLGMVMQHPNLFPGTVADNLRFGPSAHGEALRDDTLRTILSSVDLAGFEDREVSSLSGGEAQRVNLARTLANNPEALLLDEPTSALDRAAKEEVEETLLSVIKSQNVTCILVTHDKEQVVRLARRVLMLKNGRIVADGSVKEVLDAESLD
jgi:putative ABC transport system ATP-binding protein